MNIEKQTLEALLSTMRDILAQGAAGKKCVGFETLSVTSAAVSRLGSIPETATSADITIDPASGSTNTSVAVRYTLDGTTPVTGVTPTGIGVPVGDYDTFEITANHNLKAFRAIAADNATGTKYLRVLYYK